MPARPARVGNRRLDGVRGAEIDAAFA